MVLQSSWPQIFSGETITLKCEIQGRGDTEWNYEWETTSSHLNIPVNQAEFRINNVSTHHSGDYRCKGRPKDDRYSSTPWSDVVKLTVLGKYEYFCVWIIFVQPLEHVWEINPEICVFQQTNPSLFWVCLHNGWVLEPQWLWTVMLKAHLKAGCSTGTRLFLNHHTTPTILSCYLVSAMEL